MVNKGTVKPYVKCIGNSATKVTGSAYLVRYKKYCLLLDCGLTQGHDIATDYKLNLKLLKKIKPKEIDYIILSHCHMDHAGLIPALYARGCQAHLYVPCGSKQFLKLLWEDSMKIFTQDCLKLNKSGKKASPFYTPEDIDKALNRIIEVEPNSPFSINQFIKLTYYLANHTIHACQVYLEFQDGYIKHRLGFTGDVGGETPQPYVESRQTIPYVNLLIGENTYNQPKRQNKQYDREKDLEKIQAVINEYHKILFGTFSLNRCQTILKILHEMWQYGKIDNNLKIIVDAPLAQKICDIWEWDENFDPFYWNNLHFVESWDESQVLQKSNDHCVIISTSNFLTGGRILEWLKTILPSSNNVLVFTGYAGENNLASEIKYGGRYVNVDSVTVQNNANIVELVSFSSHANYEELMDYYANQCRYDKIALVHGDMKYKPDFARKLQDKLVEQGKSSRVICTNEDTKIYF